MIDVDDACTGFHWDEGWYFKRMPDASVRVSHVVGFPKPRVESQIIIPRGCWASIVSTVSQYGETSDTFALIRAFHGS